MTRDRYSEKVPFRLTRMLINAMEVSGIEGSYRVTCELVMGALRANKDSVMAMLEAFVYDPLINWRLLTGNSPGTSPSPLFRISRLTWPADATKQPKREKDKNSIELPSGKMSMPELINERAVSVIQRVSKKLTGRDFGDTTIGVSAQVQKLIEEATSSEALCQSYMGWCPFW